MKVLLVNNAYEPASGGAETVVLQTAVLLRRAGHQVLPFAIATDRTPVEYRSGLPRWDALARRPSRMSDSLATVYSHETGAALERIVDEARPDVAHLHNVYERLTLSIVDVLHRRGVPTVMTLHDYRAICPNGRLWNDGGLCERCPDSGSFRHAVRRRCQQGSLVASAVAATEAYLNQRSGRYRRVDVLVAPSAFLREKVSRRLQHPRFHIVRNPVERRTARGYHSSEPRFVLSGRMVPEKGLDVALDAASRLPAGARMCLIGEGRYSDAVAARIARERLPVDVLGHVDRRRLSTVLRRATAVLVPSVWYENCPMAILEAGAVGVPVIASDLPAMQELVEDGRDGLLVPPGNAEALAEAMRRLIDHPDEAAMLGRRARKRVRDRHRPSRYLRALLRCYGQARAAHPGSTGR